MTDKPSARADTTRVLEAQPSGRWAFAKVRVLNASASPAERILRSGALILGAGAAADIVIAEPSVSRRHAQLSFTPDGVELVDLESRNGTSLYGNRIERVLLESSGTFQLGTVRVAVELVPSQVETDSGTAPAAFGGLLGKSRAMQEVFAVLERLKASKVPLLVEGESGTGKEVVARAVHEHSVVKSGPFVALNCGAIDRSLARSELFGHRRGAFTGALETRAGAFEEANGGTLFLDEIGELPLEVQPLLLRALEIEKVARIGESQERPVSVRVVAATNRDLSREVAAGRFRADLYYRLNVVRVVMPALRDRREDIELLARHFAAEFGIEDLSGPVLDDLKHYDWPGNVRELRNVLRGYAAIGVLPQRSATEASAQDEGYSELFRRALDMDVPYQEQKERLLAQFIDTYVEMLLERTGGNQSEAARIAGLDRAHLNKMVKRLKQRPAT